MFGSLLSMIAIARVKDAASRAIRDAMLGAAAALMMLIAAGFMVAAGFIAIAQAAGPIVACLVIAGLFIFAGLVLWLVKLSRRRPAYRPPAAMPGAAAAVGAASPDGGGGGRSADPGPQSGLGDSALVFALPALAFVAAVMIGRSSKRNRDD